MKLQNLHFYNHLANSIIEELLNKLWQGVAIKNIERALPKTTNIQTSFTYQSLLLMLEYVPKKSVIFEQQIDPTPAQMDTLGSGNVNLTSNLQSKSIRQNNQQSQQYTNQKLSNLKKGNLQRKISKQSNQNSFFTKIQDGNNENILINEDKLRGEYLLGQQMQVKQLLAVKQQQKNRTQSSTKNSKILKQHKKFTYGYQGEIFKIGGLANIKNKIRKIQSQFSKNTLIPKQFPPPIVQNLDISKQSAKNPKTNDRDKTKSLYFFTDNAPKSIIENFNEQRPVAQGVKVIQAIGNQNIIKQTKKKALSGYKKYRLEQFKQFAKGRKFTEHKNSNFSNSRIENQQIQQIEKQKKNANDNFKSEKSFNIDKVLQGYNVLPPLKKGSKSILKQSDKSLNYSNLSIKDGNSRILVENCQLFAENFKKRQPQTILFEI